MIWVPPCWLMHELCCLLQMKNNNNNNKMESFHEVSTTVCSLFEQESTEGLSVCVCVCVFSDCMISTVISCWISWSLVIQGWTLCFFRLHSWRIFCGNKNVLIKDICRDVWFSSSWSLLKELLLVCWLPYTTGICLQFTIYTSCVLTVWPFSTWYVDYRNYQ